MRHLRGDQPPTLFRACRVEAGDTALGVGTLIDGREAKTLEIVPQEVKLGEAICVVSAWMLLLAISRSWRPQRTVGGSAGHVGSQCTQGEVVPGDAGRRLVQLRQVLRDRLVGVNSALEQNEGRDHLGDGADEILGVAVQVARAVDIGLGEMMVFPQRNRCATLVV